VPTLEEEAPEASSAAANASAAVPPASLPSSAWAWPMVARPDSAGVWKARAATASMAMFTRPAQAEGGQHVELRSGAAVAVPGSALCAVTATPGLLLPFAPADATLPGDG
jgi:hypothetical protein